MLLAHVAPGAAHQPYFTQVQKVVLPDATMGEIRLLHGDGGPIRSDPVRAIIVGSDGRLRARSPRTWAMVLLCSGEHECRAIDLYERRAYELELATFQLGPAIPRTRNPDWSVEDGNESWGFQSRPASFVEILWGNFVFARSHLHLVVFFALFGALATAVGTVALRRPPSRPAWALMLWIVGLLLRMGLVGLVLAFSIVCAGVLGSTGLVWLAATGVGAAFVLVPLMLLRGRTLRLTPG